MIAKEMKNIVASVLARLRNNSKSSGAPFQQILQQYASWKVRGPGAVHMLGP